MTTALQDAVRRFQDILQYENAQPRIREEYPRTIKRLDRELNGLFDPPEVMRAKLSRWRQALDVGLLATPPQFSPSKVRNDVATLRRFYAAISRDLDTLRRRLYPANPAVDLPSVGPQKWTPKPIPLGDARKLMRACRPDRPEDADTLRDRAMIECYYNGCRITETCSLTLHRVVFDEARRSLTVRVLEKGGEERTVPLRQASARWLAQVLVQRLSPEREAELLALVRPGLKPEDEGNAGIFVARLALGLDFKNSTEPVFLWSGRAITRREADLRFAYHRERAGLPDSYTPHRFRHACATEMLNAGEDLRTIMEVLGHKDIRTTQRYLDVGTEKKGRALDRLPDLDEEGV